MGGPHEVAAQPPNKALQPTAKGSLRTRRDNLLAFAMAAAALTVSALVRS